MGEQRVCQVKTAGALDSRSTNALGRESIAESSGAGLLAYRLVAEVFSGFAPNDVLSASQQRNYSCATAHVFHVIPSWQPHYRAEPGDVLLFQRSDVLNVSVFGKYDNTDAKIRFFCELGKYYRFFYFPMQKREKMVPRTSSEVT